MPVWQSIYEELKDKNFEIISAAQDTGGEEAAGRFYDEANVSYTALIDQNHTISSLYNLIHVPSGVWIDESGKIARINIRTFSRPRNGEEESPYVIALRDWIDKGSDSEYAWDTQDVISKIRQRTPDELLAEPTFKLGNYFFANGDEESANIYWERARELNPDAWNYFRQSWYFEADFDEGRRRFGERMRELNNTQQDPLFFSGDEVIINN
ncbi:MAG: hypothetical protein COA96_10060 [SAR86 cluster bacterium]|uniref:Uncharacterized protein n=1 Tax=SAR86 cluster bacterium TaxID=2030880 RepID=A0A2A5AYL4_9GAMM|nr:MAG: hypothetical protein COA96_10060 [SAR86 cluster bacterium]